MAIGRLAFCNSHRLFNLVCCGSRRSTASAPQDIGSYRTSQPTPRNNGRYGSGRLLSSSSWHLRSSLPHKQFLVLRVQLQQVTKESPHVFRRPISRGIACLSGPVNVLLITDGGFKSSLEVL